MSYQALARRWRPRGFDSLVGQNHIVQALTHSLIRKQLHHAYLFTGTRGVGKTTLARILAKALNCEQGITASPCNKCVPCLQVDSASFIDYIELDAASNRGVEEMTTILERVMYAPVNARFKIYMIDEVHMLSNHAFNAMLKTLEEPPDFVKFILATTEPEKIPVTILSRCLQFNLKRMTEGDIVQYLETVLKSEAINFENDALNLIARASDGSMRDALSILDQVIVFSEEVVSYHYVRQMLGLVGEDIPVKLLEALHKKDARQIVDISEQILLSNISFQQTLDTIARVLHRLAWFQIDSSINLPKIVDQEYLLKLSHLFTPEEIQLFYKITLSAKNELSFAPDDFSGFTMAFLRMLAFRPQFGSVALNKIDKSPDFIDKNNLADTDKLLSPVNKALQISSSFDSSLSPDVTEALAAKKFLKVLKAENTDNFDVQDAKLAKDVIDDNRFLKKKLKNDGKNDERENVFSDWPALAAALPLKGLARELAMQSEFVSFEKGRLLLKVSSKTLLNEVVLKKMEDALQIFLKIALKVSVKIGSIKDTANFRNKEMKRVRSTEVKELIIIDPIIEQIVENFDGTLLDENICVKD